MTEDYYQILGLLYDASQDDIKLAYRQLAKAYHPDVNNGDTEKEDRFKMISQAYETLSNAEKKNSYDLWLLLKLSERNTGGVSADSQGSWAYNKTVWPRYQPYKKGPVTYSKKTYIIATTLVVALFLSIFLIPVMLAKYSSEYHYKKAVEFYQGAHYYSALTSLDHAIVDFGNKNAEACLLTAIILMEQYQQYNDAVMYAEKGIEKVKDPKDKASFYYIKGKALKENGAYDSSRVAFEMALHLWNFHSNREKEEAGQPRFWSAQPETDALLVYLPPVIEELSEQKLNYAIGEIAAFFQNDYTSAIKSFNEIILTDKQNPDAYYGRAFCAYNLHKPQEAVNDFDYFLRHRPEHGMAYYFRGIAKIQLDSVINGCEDLIHAQSLGVRESGMSITQYCMKE